MLHGGTGLTREQFADLISRGCAKVNISTALKIAFVDAHREWLDANPGKHDPPSMLSHVHEVVKQMAEHHIGMFGSAGRARSLSASTGRHMPALIFDCDGVLADTERDGHRPAFNETFAEVGLPVRWSEEEYAIKLRIGGGKERMASLLTDEFVRANGLPVDPEGQTALLADWHRRKTARYKEIVPAGRLPARPGIARIVDQALDAGWTLAVASTSAEESVRAVLEQAVGAANAARFAMFAGDIVPPRSRTRRSTSSPSSASQSAAKTRS